MRHSPDKIAEWNTVPDSKQFIMASAMNEFIEMLDAIRSGNHPLYRVTELTIK